jgi:hypothetical protein
MSRERDGDEQRHAGHADNSIGIEKAVCAPAVMPHAIEDFANAFAVSKVLSNA